jgi:hypothetical protein
MEIPAKMKKLLILLSLLCVAGPSLFATRFENAPISSDDVAKMLALNANKYVLTFDSPKHAVLKYESPTGTQEVPLAGLTSTVTLLTYVPSDNGPNPIDGFSGNKPARGPLKPLYFWFSGANGSTFTSFWFDASKTNTIRTEFIKGVFTISAYEFPGTSKTPLYRIQVLEK